MRQDDREWRFSATSYGLLEGIIKHSFQEIGENNNILVFGVNYTNVLYCDTFDHLLRNG
jgi:hypothetical protein